MKKVYVVTAGDYSDYCIYAVCSSKKNADKVIALATSAKEYWISSASVEIWNVDECLTWKHIHYWAAAIWVDTGEISANKGADGFDDFCPSYRAIVVQKNEFNGRLLLRVRSTISQKHAEKFAVEQRQKQLREKGLVG